MDLNSRFYFLVVLLKYCLIIVSSEAPESNEFYTAAVVEYYRTIEPPGDKRNVDAEATLNINTEYYLKILTEVVAKIEEEKKRPLDIIVYPESTLYTGVTNIDYHAFGTLVPLASDNKAPCNDTPTYRKFLSDLSCAARQRNTYIVVNVVEHEECTEEQISAKTCSDHGFNLYNTNVAFNRDGAVVAKYRKYNLFKEPLNQTDYAEKVTFETDFGVTFGTFTCFDIMFASPALELVAKGIKHFVFPSMWFSELPFLVSVQAQEMWARENEVVLLASGALNPDVGSGGSGIYQGSHGAIENILTAEKTSQHYIIREVPKQWAPYPKIPYLYKPKQTPSDPSEESIESLDNFVLIWDNNTEYSSQTLNMKELSQSATVCNTVSGFENGQLPEGEQEVFCCEFIILTKAEEAPQDPQKDSYYYRMFAYSGVRSFSGAYNGGLEVCGLVACTDIDDPTTCGKRFPDATNIIWPITFTKIIIQANFTKSTKRAQFPNSLRWNLKSIPAVETGWESVNFDTQVLRTHMTIAEQRQLLTFGIYGRDFARDSEPNGAPRYIGQEFVMLVVVFAVVMVSIMVNFHQVY